MQSFRDYSGIFLLTPFQPPLDGCPKTLVNTNRQDKHLPATVTNQYSY